MTSSRPGVDLEKELTCSICTDILYQPLTLLDCLHTFCGSCLKDWFSWQKNVAENSPNPPSPGSIRFTCPSCRAQVRDTRHNATVTTLLDMFLAANPDKAKPDDEKEEMRKKYKPGDNVIPRIRILERSLEERRLEEMERRMLEQARQMSLQDVGVEPGEGSRPRRHHGHSRSEDGRSRSEWDNSREMRYRDEHDRPLRGDGHRRRHDSNGMLQPDPPPDERRRYRSESQHRSRDSSRTRRRQVEHQASIRSLISSSDVDFRDIEREIEEFARQIQEEGLLDGLDLDNIDLAQNDELSRKITEAYRRRQRDRIRGQQPRRSDPAVTSQRPEALQPNPRPPPTDTSRASSRPRSRSANSRSATSQSQADDRSRPPVTSTHLEVRADPERRRRRRTSSDARSVTDPVRPRTAETRPAARSQTDLTLRPQSTDPSARRPSITESRSSSMPTTNSAAQPPAGEGSRPRDLSFSARTSAAQIPLAPSPEPHSDDSSVEHPKRARRPSSVAPQSPLPSLGLISSPSHQTHHQHTRSQFYQEPAITCSRCSRPHIEYELHYNCARCANGAWNICSSCYRSGKGCENWFGFGYAAFKNWQKVIADGNRGLEPPHMLTSCRYRQPKYAPGGAEGRRTLTTDDPANRLESGMFCVGCLAWANECFWRCESCNEGDWGFCNNCVNAGKNCTHPLLPLAYVAPGTGSSTPPASPPLPKRPRGATLSSGPNAVSLGNFKSLTFTTTCEVCHGPIPPTDKRYHCFECSSKDLEDGQPGDYDICEDCYIGLVHDKRISDENGHMGWRRCLEGHRMAVIGFMEGLLGLRRCVLQDIVGGRSLRSEPYEGTGVPDDEQHQPRGARMQRWSWKGPNGLNLERLVAVDVAATAPALGTELFPPDGGAGSRAVAKWSWYPRAGVTDELLFPKGAEVREVEDVNGEWLFGSYMGAQGLFPAPYVRIIE
ncbi:uncharacterized protein F4812DRAFT_59103 [Daldinia caldariorum]|uniref:uncharacterized protein n=1 Tax=Daldinia caldariorum TaxID=326644 RepID=UPI002007C061|nr:uncharacterized protein F4812DRAFT_59103 [Daldinia caldariorum]KAI1467321.1 hypothetical protein F4812DRAFT_59103 [Daldinia caldariorum]